MTVPAPIVVTADYFPISLRESAATLDTRLSPMPLRYCRPDPIVVAPVTYQRGSSKAMSGTPAQKCNSVPPSRVNCSAVLICVQYNKPTPTHYRHNNDIHTYIYTHTALALLKVVGTISKVALLAEESKKLSSGCFSKARMARPPIMSIASLPRITARSSTGRISLQHKPTAIHPMKTLSATGSKMPPHMLWAVHSNISHHTICNKET